MIWRRTGGLQARRIVVNKMGAREIYDGPFKAAGDEEVAAISVEENIQPDWTEEEERLAKRK